MTDPRRAELFIVALAFSVAPEHRRDFERTYGEHGDWVRLFRTGYGYIKTELHRDPANLGRYITLDFWTTRQQYESFRDSSKAAYNEIDARCERLTQDEQLLGDFSDLTSLHAAFPQLGHSTQVESCLTIRSMHARDIAAVLGIEQAAPLAAHWARSAYEELFRPNAVARIALVAENAGGILYGFLMARLTADECELENIVVIQEQGRQGTGSTLLQELCDTARARGIQRIFLEVRESNLPARRLYEKLGFVRDGERGSYYSEPVEKAILYSLSL